jgi:hypothetical protein
LTPKKLGDVKAAQDLRLSAEPADQAANRS